MNYLPQFKIYLQSHNYSLATIRNYLADIGRYQTYVIANAVKQSQEDRHVPQRRDDASGRDVARYVSTKDSNDNSSVIASPSSVIASPPPPSLRSANWRRSNPLPARLWREIASSSRNSGTPRNDVLRDDVFLFDPETLKSYISSLTSDPNFRRYLSSLTKFCHFALDQQLITSNPIKHILRQLHSPPKTNLDDLLKQYQSYLTKKNKTPVTIKNYINDIQQYIRFCQNPSVIASPSSVIASPSSVIASERSERSNPLPARLWREIASSSRNSGTPRNDALRDDVTQ